MENFKLDIEQQLVEVLRRNTMVDIKDIYGDDLKEIFSCIYMINYLSNRVELKKNFTSKYFEVTMSCMIEAFDLLVTNHVRGSSLVLRSSLESFLKHILEVCIYNIDDKSYKINDRCYNANKITLDNIINNYIKESFRGKCISLNSKMETKYGKLSGISHSLVVESTSNTLLYFEDLSKVNKQNIELIIKYFIEISKCVFSFCIILCEKSFKNWNSDELKKILTVIFGKNQSKTYLCKLKE